MTIGEKWKKFSRWLNTRTCKRMGHKWYPENGPLPKNCPMCEEIDATRCHLLPEGWFCTRNPQHGGPCAAWPIEPNCVECSPENFVNETRHKMFLQLCEGHLAQIKVPTKEECEEAIKKGQEDYKAVIDATHTLKGYFK